MELRNLQANDLFSMVRILNGIGFNEIKGAIDIPKLKELKNTMSEENSEEIIMKAGTDVIMSIVGIIVENLPKVENDLYIFVGNLTGVKPKEVATMDATEFVDTLIAIFTMDGFKDFFKRASKLIK